MNVPVWVHELAAGFWELAGGPEPFPRSLRAPLTRGPFDLTIKELPALTTRAAEAYLNRFGGGWACGDAERALRACLAARDGAGFILLDAADPPAERTFSLAHELAHFLRHFRQRRQRAERLVGPRAAEVIDQRRAPTPAERLRALLSHVPLGPHVHLMEREPQHSTAVALAEEEADRLAYELLAPAEAVTDAAGLQTHFGLPAVQAVDYWRLLAPPTPADPLMLRLRR